MSAAADDSLHPDRMINSPAGNKVYQISFIGSMGMAGMGSTTIRAGLHFRIKTCHKRVKEVTVHGATCPQNHNKIK